VSSARIEHTNVHPQEDMYMLFCGISFNHPYMQSGRWQDVLVIKLIKKPEVYFRNVGNHYDLTKCYTLSG
jgi:hypothetical protein